MIRQTFSLYLFFQLLKPFIKDFLSFDFSVELPISDFFSLIRHMNFDWILQGLKDGWIAMTWLEAIAVFFGISSVFYSIKKNTLGRIRAPTAHRIPLQVLWSRCFSPLIRVRL